MVDGLVSAAYAAYKGFAKQNLEMDGLARTFESNAGFPRVPGARDATSQIHNVMDGDLDGFLNAYLTQLATGELKK